MFFLFILMIVLCGVCRVVCSMVWFLVILIFLFWNMVLCCVFMFVVCVSFCSSCSVLLVMWCLE